MPSERRWGSPSMRYRGEGWTTAETAPAPEFTLAMVCGAAEAPGQNGHEPEAVCCSASSPTMTQERVMGSLRNSMLCLGKQRRGAASIERHNGGREGWMW